MFILKFKKRKLAKQIFIAILCSLLLKIRIEVVYYKAIIHDEENKVLGQMLPFINKLKV